MILNGSVGRAPKSACLSTHCDTLKLKAQNDAEAEWLAELIKALRDGVTITITDVCSFSTEGKSA